MTRSTLIVALLLAASSAGPTAQSSELALGLIRADGILVPFAVFDGTSWLEAWPEPGEPVAPDHMLAAVPSFWRKRQQQVPQAWHVAAERGAMVEVNVLSHVVFDEHCGHQVGLLTDLHPRRADAHDKRLAADRAVPMILPLDLSASADRAGWQDLAQLLEAESAHHENTAIADWERDSGRTSQLEPAPRRQPLRIRTLYAHRDTDSRIVYYEVERQYAKPISDSPGAEPSVLFVSGWIYQATGSAPSTLNTVALITDPDFKGPVTMKPLGIVRAGGSALWVVQVHGYESEAVMLLRIDSKGAHRVFSAFIGGC
ncbi:MAG TPA: hypothetical protein VMN81_11500 [Vicinamibacterales bacterium]|nr:hypothetical protein [Vicinamibacterales bacterium]